MIWGETSPDKLKNKISYYVRRGYLVRLARGVYVKASDYNPKEFAVRVYSPSYISFETVFLANGMTFQYYETIFIAAPWSKDLQVDKYKFTFRRLKKSVLYNPAGIITENHYSVATPERAFLDMIYLAPKYYFDNLDRLDWEKCFELAEIYNSKRLIETIKIYQKKYVE